jgi:hypothetical protein
MSKSRKTVAENHGQKVTSKELAIIKRLIKEHTPTADIAKAVGRSLAALRKITFRAGLSLRNRVANVKKAVKPSVTKKTTKKAARKSKRGPILIH